MTETILSTTSPPSNSPDSGSESPEPIDPAREIRRLRAQVEELERMLAYQARATRLLATPVTGA